MLNRMVEEGFAVRTGDQDDRRNVSYELTDAGALRLTAEIQRETDRICTAFDGMGNEKICALAARLKPCSRESIA